MLWVTMMIAVFILSRTFIISLTMMAWFVTSRAEVGSSAKRSFGFMAIAIAMPTRWRIPPESS